MILQTVERIATWLGNVTYGVNALLPSVPRLGADAVPPNVTILDERQNPAAARRQFKRDQSWPVLVVSLAQDIQFDIRLEAGVRDCPDLPIAIAYCEKLEPTDRGARDALYTMVAVERSLHALFYGGGTAADRTNGTVSLVYPVRLQQVKLFAPVQDEAVTMAVVASYYVRDTSP